MVWPFRKKKSADVVNITTSKDLDEFLQFGGAESAAGLRITRQAALELSVVLQCVRVLCNGVAQVPFRLYKRNGRNNEAATSHPLYELIGHEPNEWQTSFDFRSMVMMHLTLTGNAYIWINRVRGEIVELLPYPPGNVSIDKTDDGFPANYIITTTKGRQITVPADDIWHISHLPWDYSGGLEAIKVARQVLGLAKATETYGSKLFKNGGRPSGILSTPAVLSAEQRKGLREDWENLNAGLQNSNKTAIIWGDLKYIPLSANNDESQFLETRKFQIEEICRAFGVSPIKVFYSDKNSTYASVEQMNISHVADTLMPIYTNFEQSGRKKLLTKEEKRNGYYFKLEAKGLLRGTIKDRGDFYTKMFNVGSMSPNDIRELEDLNPYEGGDNYFVPLNMAAPGNTASQEDENGN